MNRFKLFTYSSDIELNKIIDCVDNSSFYEDFFVCNKVNVNEIKELNYTVIDLSLFIDGLKLNFINDFYFPQSYEIETTCKFIVKKELEKDTLNYLNFIFDSSEKIGIMEDSEIKKYFVPFTGLELYTYKNNEFKGIIDYFNENKIPFTHFNRLINKRDDLFKMLSSISENSFIDITHLVELVKVNPSVVSALDLLIEQYSDSIFIIDENYVEDALKIFNTNFLSKKNISELITIKINENFKQDNNFNVTTITNLKEDEFNNLIINLKSELWGHENFKNRFEEKIEDFRILNQANLSNIFSVLLIGDSGLGKTEFARIIKKELNPKTPLIKINFGNYSSENSLNNLIGSPRGYVGSEEGELSLKINKSKAGVILCDEFEKATPKVFSFFLELLEDGKFTDSQGREYNLNGYIVVFTTNLLEQQFLNILPNELKSRIDLVSKFVPLSIMEKEKFIQYQAKNLLNDLSNIQEFSLAVKKLQKQKYYLDVDLISKDNLRDLKRLIYEDILKKIKELN